MTRFSSCTSACNVAVAIQCRDWAREIGICKRKKQNIKKTSTLLLCPIQCKINVIFLWGLFRLVRFMDSKLQWRISTLVECMSNYFDILCSYRGLLFSLVVLSTVCSQKCTACSWRHTLRIRRKSTDCLMPLTTLLVLVRRPNGHLIGSKGILIGLITLSVIFVGCVDFEITSILSYLKVVRI